MTAKQMNQFLRKHGFDYQLSPQDSDTEALFKILVELIERLDKLSP